MKTPRHQVAALLAKKSLAGSINKARFSKEIAAYLLDAGRTGELDSLLRDVTRYRADHGIVEVTAVSAYELSPAVLRDVKAQARALHPNAKHIIINQRRDPEILGGVRLELVDKQLDLSIRNKLNRFKELTTLERIT